MTIYKTMLEQYNAFIEKGGIFISEHKLNTGDYLLVDYMVTQYGLRFSFDQDNKPVWFDGDIQGGDGDYVIRWDKCFTDIDYYLDLAVRNVDCGYISANNLDCFED